MSRDEILKMSMEAGFAGWKCDEEKIERFFRAAYEAGAAAEREACGDDGAMVTETLESQGWKK
jgi:hypothetical protein